MARLQLGCCQEVETPAAFNAIFLQVDHGEGMERPQHIIHNVSHKRRKSINNPISEIQTR